DEVHKQIDLILLFVGCGVAQRVEQSEGDVAITATVRPFDDGSYHRRVEELLDRLEIGLARQRVEEIADGRDRELEAPVRGRADPLAEAMQHVGETLRDIERVEYPC